MIYPKEKTREISFPLGGIGAGCIGLGGDGRLVDWEIFNRPNKGGGNGLSHFAVRAEKDGKVIDWRVLQGDLAAPYTGPFVPEINTYKGFGWGPLSGSMCGYPHFREHEFRGEYPVGTVTFGGEKAFPGKAALTGWSVLIPGNDRDSSLPAAFFEIELENNAAETLDYTVAGITGNPWREAGHFNLIAANQLHLSSGLDPFDFGYGMLALTLLPAKGMTLSGQEYWYRGGWCDDQETYWRDMEQAGPFRPRRYETGSEGFDHGLLAGHFRLAPGERRRVCFVLTWHVPNRRNDWSANENDCASNGVANRWRNWYATAWRDAADSGDYAAKEYERLREETFRFRDTLFASTLPEAVLDGVSANISILKSPTCLRLEDGTFYGWEGCGRSWGSCEGSCTHVWNYQQTLPFLFPALERSMREAHLDYGVDENGGHHFRLRLPLGVRAKKGDFRPCLDGQFGDLMKFYRDWKICGDGGWLKQYYPTLKRMVEYAWSKENPDRWDPEQSGIPTGRQHHTLDMELFGPNAWLAGHYLGGIKAMAEMADAVGDEAFAILCRELFERGKKRLDAELFNGEYYAQDIDLAERSLLAGFKDVDNTYWNAEAGEIKYQLGEGLEIDVTIAQLYAGLYGLGEVFDPERDRSTLQALLRHNFRRDMRATVNVWRSFAVNDEGGVLVAAWPEGRRRPAIPLPYNTEMMCGMEWAFAAHLVCAGMAGEGALIAETIRRRYDGERRNPWNEIECGSNYARSMAAYAMLNAFSGLRYDLTRKMIGFSPAVNKRPFRCFWSLGAAWGAVEFTADRATLEIAGGEIDLAAVELNGVTRPVEPKSYRAGDKVVLPAGSILADHV